MRLLVMPGRLAPVPVLSGTELNPGVNVDSTRDLQALLDDADRDGADA